jgi:hypothetical protein
MAHLKKIMRGAVPGLAVHFERKTDHHTNKEIDVSQTYLNQDIMTDGSDMVSRFNARLNDVYCMQRDDVKEPVSDLDSHSYPKILQKRPTSNKAPFLKKPPIFLMNVMVKKMPWPLLCIMTRQPLTCTMSFRPRLFLINKKSRYKVSAKEVLTRHDLQTFHDDLDQDLKKVLL